VFFRRYQEVTDWAKILDKADKGDKRALKEQETAAALEKKIANHPNPWISFPITYHGNKGKFFSGDNDTFILLAIHKYGYGCWDRLQREIRASPRFRFDWYIKSRAPQDIQKRADLLLKLIEREIDTLAKKAAAAAAAAVSGEPTTDAGAAGGAVEADNSMIDEAEAKNDYN
jgi:SWI/SNF-related matrix-associated actin-dependent regulator of chromatin subfamily A member 5